MVQEAETAVAAPAPPPPAKTAEPEAPTTGAEEEALVTPGEETGEESPAPEEQSEDEEDYTALKERILSKEHLKSAYDADLEEVRKEARSETQRRLQPLAEKASKKAAEYAQNTAHLAQSVDQVFGLLNKAEREGTLDEGTVGQAIARFAPAFAEVMGGMSYSRGYYDSAAHFTAKAAEVMGIPELAQKFSSRWQNLHLDADDYNVIVADWVEAATAEKEKKAEDRGYNRGLKDGRKAGSAITKAGVRDGQGADTAQKGAGGGGGKLTYAQIQKMTPSQIEALPEGALQAAIDAAS